MNKAVLLFLSCLLLVSVSGCGSSAVTGPNGFLYSANSFRPGSMAAFSVTTGALVQIAGTPFVTAGSAPYTIAASPPALPSPAPAVTTKFLYAGIPATSKGGVITRLLGRTLSGSVTGGIMLMPVNSDHTLATSQMFASGGDYDPIAVAPSGNFLYAIDLTANHLAAFSIDSSKGSLTAIGPPAGVAVGPDPFNVVVDPQGKFVFVANCDCVTNPQNHGSVSVFSINNDGTLTAVGTFVPGGTVTAQPIALAVSPNSQFLFIAGLDDNVYVESIAAGGTLTGVSCPPIPPNPNSPCALPPGSMPVSIAVSIDGGNTVYTGNAGTGTVSFFLNCTQTPLPIVATTSVGCPTDGNGNALTPVAFQNNNPVGGTVGVVVPDPSSIAASTTVTAINPGHFLYVTDYDHGTILVFAVTSSTTCTMTSCPTTAGTLTQSGSMVNTGGQNPFGLAFSF
ncbi:MAG TPA: beta-propeller fold lactonase family protein [Terriglobales bacterium]|nr:beta-propeller fold lactonase family protein [Terriglobales bacterium]